MAAFRASRLVEYAISSTTPIRSVMSRIATIAAVTAPLPSWASAAAAPTIRSVSRACSAFWPMISPTRSTDSEASVAELACSAAPWDTWVAAALMDWLALARFAALAFTRSATSRSISTVPLSARAS